MSANGIDDKPRAGIDRAVLALAGVSPRAVVAVVLAGAAIFGVFGTTMLWGGHPNVWFDLDAEHHGSATFSSLALVMACVYAWAFARTGGRTGWARLAGPALSFFFFYMAIDEFDGSIHENLQGVGGHSWVVIMSPVMALGGVLWLAVLRDLPTTRARAVFVAGAALWVLAIIMEWKFWGNDDVRQTPWSMTVEEIAEMCGSSSFGLALLLGVRERLRSARLPSLVLGPVSAGDAPRSRPPAGTSAG